MPSAQSLSSGGHWDFCKVPGAAWSLGEDRGGEARVQAPGSERDKAKGDEEVNTEGTTAGAEDSCPFPGARQLH